MNYELVDDLADVPGNKLIIYVITHRTKDWGEKYVLRRQSPGRNMIYMEREPFAVADSLVEVQAKLPADVVRFAPTVNEDPVVVETWL